MLKTYNHDFVVSKNYRSWGLHIDMTLDVDINMNKAAEWT